VNHLADALTLRTWSEVKKKNLASSVENADANQAIA
jgi:hypothetical protein